MTEPKTRLRALVKHSLEALRDPTRADAVSAVGDLSSQAALIKIRHKMCISETGRQILEDKPRVNSQTWPLEEMLKLKSNSFGFQYASWMSQKDFSSDERPVVKYVQDLELAYII